MAFENMIPDRSAAHVNVKVSVTATNTHQTVSALYSRLSITLYKYYCYYTTWPLFHDNLGKLVPVK